ncbi:MAG: ABC transporter permease [Bacillota bacterium]|nr:ABC transporter permease [Bacillota bacterium]
MKIFSIAKFDLIKMLRDKTSFVIMLVLPIAFIVIFGGLAGGSYGDTKIPVGITNLDKSRISTSLLDEIKKDNTLEISELDKDTLYDKVKNANVEIGFVIPGDFSQKITEGKDAEIQTIKLSESADYSVIQGIINNAFTKLRLKEGTISYLEENMKNIPGTDIEKIIPELGKIIDANLSKPELITVNETKFADKNKTTDYDPKANMSISAILMFVMYTVVLGAGDILEEKKVNTWGRLSITPTSRSTVICGKVFGTFLKGWVQIALVMLFGKFVMGVNWGTSMLDTIILISVYLLCVTGLGMFMSTLVKTNAQLGAISAIVITATTMLAGCYWPLDFEPVIMQKIAVLFPQYWANLGLTNTVVGGLGIETIVTPVLILLGMGVVYFALSVLGGRFKVEAKRSVKKAAAVKRGSELGVQSSEI